MLLPVTATVAAAGLTGAAASAAVGTAATALMVGGVAGGGLIGQSTTYEDIERFKLLLAEGAEETRGAGHGSPRSALLARHDAAHRQVRPQDRWCKTGAEREETNAPLRILVVDGGGIKGLIPALVLTKLEEMCWPHPLSEVFDLVAGTSTGGIVALGTMMSNATPAEMAEVYESRASSIWTAQTGGSARKLVGSAICEYWCTLTAMSYCSSRLTQRMWTIR